MSSAADGDAPETGCGLEDASLRPLWARNQGQGQTTKLSSLGSQSQPFSRASYSQERHPCSTLGHHTRFSRVSEAKGVRRIIPASVTNHHFHSFGCACSSAPKMLGQAFVQPHKRRRWLLKEQISHSIFTPDDIAFIPKIAADRLGGTCSFLFILLFCNCLRRPSP